MLWVIQHRCAHLPVPNPYAICTTGSPGKAVTLYESIMKKNFICPAREWKGNTTECKQNGN